MTHSGVVALRPLRDDDHDVALMARWLSDPRVLEWIIGRDDPADEASIREEYGPRARGEVDVRSALILLDGRPVGHVQYYPIESHAAAYGISPEQAAGAWAFDLFVGEPELWGSGVGTRALRMAVDLVFVEHGAIRVLIDPREVNLRAIRAYEKVGFRRIDTLPVHEHHEGEDWDCAILAIEADRDVVAMTARLAKVDSVNPSLVPGAAGEADVAEVVAGWCESHGLEVHRSEAAPGRPNVVAVRRGRGSGRSLVLNAHLDTVGVTSSATMHVGCDGDRLIGRGVLDTKGGLAAAMLAISSFGDGDLAGDVILAAVADEEHASLGTEAFVAEWRSDAAVVLEPTDLEVLLAHRGFAVIEVVVHGLASHTSRPDRGRNAVHLAAEVIAAVRALDDEWAADDPRPHQRPTVLVSGIRSDGETFTVPPSCSMVVEVRTTAADPDGEIGAVLARIAATAGDNVTTTVTMQRPPMATSSDHPFVNAVADAMREAAGGCTLGTAPYWTDAALHARAGAAAVVLGPVGEGLHEDREWVLADSLRRCEAALTSLVRSWCGPGEPDGPAVS